VPLDPHHLGEPPVAPLLLGDAEQGLRLVAALDLEIGVAGENRYQPRISTPGKSDSRLAPITCSSGTK
jgi:hypothetical protein